MGQGEIYIFAAAQGLIIKWLNYYNCYAKECFWWLSDGQTGSQAAKSINMSILKFCYLSIAQFQCHPRKNRKKMKKLTSRR